MAGTSLLTLIDNIAVILDDVSVMTKIAVKKTAGVLGDDLALNANQVQGVKADRELPVVWAVAKGSFINKLILVPIALLLSFIASKFGLPWLITLPLMLGGLYLCFEGAEKVIHQFWPHHTEEHDAHLQANIDENIDLVQFEKDKIKGAIRTDFILSAEIIVISLGFAGANADLIRQFTMLMQITVIMTVGVYGLVAGIVKLDDLGLWLHQKGTTVAQKMGSAILAFAPMLMKFLSIAGTLAMFLVGGEIIAHGIPAVHHFQQSLVQYFPIEFLGNKLFVLIFGFALGAVVVAVLSTVAKLKAKS